MVPANSGNSSLTEIKRAGAVIPFTLSTIKGIEYAFFDASVTADYTAHYGPATTTTITGQVTLQGRPVTPGAHLIVPVKVELYTTGIPTPVATYNTSTNANGEFILTGVPLGTFNIKVKGSITLARVKLSQNLLAGNNSIDFGELLAGDANDDNYVDLLDFGTLLLSYNMVVGPPPYDANADFNGDDEVDLLDFGLLLLNYNQPGEENP
jgi:hypothetical protein